MTCEVFIGFINFLAMFRANMPHKHFISRFVVSSHHCLKRKHWHLSIGFFYLGNFVRLIITRVDGDRAFEPLLSASTLEFHVDYSRFCQDVNRRRRWERVPAARNITTACLRTTTNRTAVFYSIILFCMDSYKTKFERYDRNIAC